MMLARYRRRLTAAVILLLLPLAGLAAVTATPGCGRDRVTRTAPAETGSLPLSMLLAGTESEGFERATTPRTFLFPDDHGPHPTFRSEWWYFTGLLQGRDDEGRPRRFGYQFTIFRQALAPRPLPRDSAWATRDLFMGHLAVSDIDGAAGTPRFHAFQRFGRDGLGLAGAQIRPFRVWVDAWRMNGADDRDGAIFPVQLWAGEVLLTGLSPTSLASSSPVSRGAAAPVQSPPRVVIDLVVAAGRGPIPQGERGWSVKGAGVGNASFYYSCTRLPTRGRLTLGARTFEVTGASWLDREWSTSALDSDVVGWDWLGVHLDDGRDLVLYRLRTRDGTNAGVRSGGDDGRAAAASLATLIDADGSTHRFGRDAFSLEPSGEWTSGDGVGHYPAGFRLRIPEARLELVIQPLLRDQELVLAVRYWEGAVAVSGTAQGRPLSGSGYLELTGYAARR